MVWNYSIKICVSIEVKFNHHCRIVIVGRCLHKRPNVIVKRKCHKYKLWRVKLRVQFRVVPRMEKNV